MATPTLAPPEAFAVRLPLFEGPFELLRFLIGRDELDVYDIPIARITADFMAYLRQLEAQQIKVAADLILTAATLMRIKARLLLPHPEPPAASPEADPRQELAPHLVGYRRFKDAVAALAEKERLMLAQFPRGNAEAELRALAQNVTTTSEDDLHDVTLYHLLRSFERAMARYAHTQDRPRRTVFVPDYPVPGQKDYLCRLAARNRRVGFAEIIQAFSAARLGLVFTFIALLKLLQLRELKLVEAEAGVDELDFNAFYFVAPAGACRSEPGVPGAWRSAPGVS